MPPSDKRSAHAKNSTRVQRMLQDVLHEALTGEETPRSARDTDEIPSVNTAKRALTAPPPEPVTRYDLDHLYDD